MYPYDSNHLAGIFGGIQPKWSPQRQNSDKPARFLLLFGTFSFKKKKYTTSPYVGEKQEENFLLYFSYKTRKVQGFPLDMEAEKCYNVRNLTNSSKSKEKECFR